MKTYAVCYQRAAFGPWLRWEAVAELALLLLIYRHAGGSWGWLGALFLLPDLAMLGYLHGPRTGAVAYNLGHSYAVAGAVLLLLWWIQGGAMDLRWLVWPIHIAFDRAVGYGLKSMSSFHETHLSARS
jgi:hypothetical protein